MGYSMSALELLQRMPRHRAHLPIGTNDEAEFHQRVLDGENGLRPFVERLFM